MTTSSVTLENMLASREARAARQRELLSQYGKPLVCLTMNIAGGEKRTGLVDFAFFEGVRRVQRMEEEVFHQIVMAHTGPEAYFVFSAEAAFLKRLCMEAEERDEVGRLFDLDVIAIDGQKLARGVQRKCLLCTNSAAACARSRAHGLREVVKKTNDILIAFAARTHAYAACGALLSEVWATPKPGLVDRKNCGAHTDMTVSTFEQSANALVPYFKACFEIGAEDAAMPYAKVMARLRRRGLFAEKEMALATGGVNTHKGMIYTFGLLLAGRGMALKAGGDFFAHASELSKSGLPEQYTRAARRPSTHGEQAYALYGVKGIRGEAEAGFPSAKRALSQLRYYERQGFSQNDAGVLTLLNTLCELQDTNLLHRGGHAGLMYAQHRAREVCALPEKERLEAANVLDEDFIARNMSPGGCADVLATAYFLMALEKLEL